LGEESTKKPAWGKVFFKMTPARFKSPDWIKMG
jgi:hypothetical protein